MTALANALTRMRTVGNTAQTAALHMKKAGTLNDFLGSSTTNAFAGYSDQAANRQRYSQFRGWVYSAINALAMEAAQQEVHVGHMRGRESSSPKKTKDMSIRRKMPSAIRRKSSNSELEIDDTSPILDLLERPNPIQHKFQFVYSFVANLGITGWGYIVAGERDGGDGLEMYSLPSTWVIPDHTKGAFAEFRIIDPNNPTASLDQKPLTRENVTFAYFPNPADPMKALAPASAQALAIRIDDRIQTSQSAFFENGLFPSAIVTVGKQPHPSVPGGLRPRLSPAQRRQVYSAIRKVSGGVANYGNPAIIDGMIESIERLSATQNELGWEKSEKTVRTRILSAFGVHPFILGEEMAGSFAQAFVVRDVFNRRVNVFLDLLSTVMTEFLPPLIEGEKKGKSKTLIWWQEAKAIDPSMEKSLWEGARTRKDVSQNEFRSFMDLPPDEDKNEEQIDKSSLQAITAVATAAKAGGITPEQAQAILSGMGISDELAKDIAGDGPPEGEEGMGSYGGESNAPKEDGSNKLTDATGELEDSLKSLRSSRTKNIMEKCGGPGSGVPGPCPDKVGIPQYHIRKALAKQAIRDIQKEYKPVHPHGFDTKEQYRDIDGMWSDKRHALHQSIIKDTVGTATPVQTPVVYLMGGGGGSGKSAALKSGLMGVPKNIVHIDSDEIKAKLPEYQAMSRLKDSRAAAYTHDESSYISKKAMKAGVEGGYNVLLDGTGDSSFESLKKKVAVARASGRRIEANYVTVDKDTAVQRNHDRAAKTGRFVPESVLKATHQNVSRIVPQAIAEGLFDKLQVFDTNTPGKVIKIATAENGQLTVHHPELWDRFLKKGRTDDHRRY